GCPAGGDAAEGDRLPRIVPAAGRRLSRLLASPHRPSPRSAVGVSAADGLEGAGDLRRKLRQCQGQGWRVRRFVLAAACAAAYAGPKPEPPPAPAAAEAPPAAAASPIAIGGVTGHVQATGAAVVVLEPKTSRAFAAPAEKPVMDQAGLTFGPELLLVR